MNRAQRRQAEREGRRPRPVIIAGDGIVAGALGHLYEARPHAELADKVPGRHRWVATGAWVIGDADVEHADDADRLKFLDHENLMYLALGCWDCERPLGPPPAGIAYASPCPAGPA